MIYLYQTSTQIRTNYHKYTSSTYIEIGIFVIDIRSELFAQNPQLTLEVASLGENFVHVIVLLWKPLGYVHHGSFWSTNGDRKRGATDGITDLINFQQHRPPTKQRTNSKRLKY
jgi:hypothetical protein